ncbi:MAG: DUF6788 family protein [Terriglobales bacterium]
MDQPRGAAAAHLRQQKHGLSKRFGFPSELLPGSLTRSLTKCGKAGCHCADGERHEAWVLTFMAGGRRRVERIPREWVEQVERRVRAGRLYQDALRDMLAANAELLVLARQQRRKRG